MTTPCMKDELQAAQDWMRKPDWADRFSAADFARWLNDRPTHLIPKVAANLDAKDMLIDALRSELEQVKREPGKYTGDDDEWFKSKLGDAYLTGDMDAAARALSGRLRQMDKRAAAANKRAEAAEASLAKLKERAPTHRHKRQGSEYTLIGVAELQLSVPDVAHYEVALVSEADQFAVYQGADGRLWCRRLSEFEDGRFEELPAASAFEKELKDG